MSWLERRRTPPPSDRSGEIDQLAAEAKESRRDAEHSRALVARQAQRVQRIHTALTHEGAVNHFTQRWADAYYRGGTT